MNTILLPAVLVAAIGLISGLGLAVASHFMAVPENALAQELEEMLPGVNCGACGFSGCAGYAIALSEKKAKNGLCSPGGLEIAHQIGALLGDDVDHIAKKAAVVLCRGSGEKTDTKFKYQGLQSCEAANQIFGGPGACGDGCIGLGDCVRGCQYGAIRICDGVAVIHPDICNACTMCVSTCPKGIIQMMDLETRSAVVYCANKEKGNVTRKQCMVGCIGCRRCVKVCEADAIAVQDNLAVIDRAKCTACGKCVAVCPADCIGL